MTEYFIIYTDAEVPPAEWATAREGEGWHGVSVPDHVWVVGKSVRHLWVTLTEMAVATSSVRLASSFSNNLIRSPVEFAHAALTLQALSGGRVDAGLGAGWDCAEMEAIGLRFPPAGERSRRLAEALAIARSLFSDGRCHFEGSWYEVDVPSIGPHVATPPRLATSTTGEITLRRVIGEVDLLELQAPGFSVPGRGSVDTSSVGAVTLHDLRARIDLARSVREDVALGCFLPFGCGDDRVVSWLSERLGGSPFAALFGAPDEVAEAVQAIADLGYQRVQLGPVTPASVEPLADALL